MNGQATWQRDSVPKGSRKLPNGRHVDDIGLLFIWLGSAHPSFAGYGMGETWAAIHWFDSRCKKSPHSRRKGYHVEAPEHLSPARGIIELRFVKLFIVLESPMRFDPRRHPDPPSVG
jgi:hypothetical protein